MVVPPLFEVVEMPPNVATPLDSPKRLFKFGWVTPPMGTKPKFWGNPELNGNPFSLELI